MPAETEKQANFMRLVGYYKKHHRMPEGAGKASKSVKKAAGSMTYQQIRDYMHKRKHG